MPQLLCSDLSSAEIRQIPWLQFILVIWNVFHNFNFYQQILSQPTAFKGCNQDDSWGHR